MYDRRINKDGLRLRKIERNVKETERITGASRPRSKGEKTSLTADSLRAPVNCLTALNTTHRTRRVPWQVGLVIDLKPQEGKQAVVAQLEALLQVIPTVCPMAGTTAPYSSSALLLQANAEAVFMAAMTQVVRSGHPFLYVVGPSVTDMGDGSDLYYTLDKVLWKRAAVELGRDYGLPTGAECGGAMSCAYDLQSGAEGALFMQAAWQTANQTIVSL